MVGANSDDHLFAGRYRLGNVVGRGGMADVVRADDDVLGRPVAVKIFRQGEPAHTEARIDAEIRTLASLSHPGLVTLYDAGTAPDTGGIRVPFLVMEFVDGPTLNGYRAGRALPGALVARMGHEIARALAYIHHRGVIHRDIKPANILVAREPASSSGHCVKLTDFGIARIVDADRLTEHGTTVGTAHYLSPEQATGTSAGPATDIYSLGLVLIECLTGAMVFDGSAVAAAVARLHRDPEVPEQLGPQWHSLLTTMTARQPENRPTADTVADALHSLSTDPPPPPATAVLPVASSTAIAAEQDSVTRRTEGSRRRRLVPLAAAALFVAVASAIAWVATGTGDEPIETSPSTSVTAPTSPAPVTTASEPSMPVVSNLPQDVPAPAFEQVPAEPPQPAVPPRNGNNGSGNADNGNSGNGNSGNGSPGNGNSGNGNGNSGNGNSGNGNSGRGN